MSEKMTVTIANVGSIRDRVLSVLSETTYTVIQQRSGESHSRPGHFISNATDINISFGHNSCAAIEIDDNIASYWIRTDDTIIFNSQGFEVHRSFKQWTFLVDDPEEIVTEFEIAD